MKALASITIAAVLMLALACSRNGPQHDLDNYVERLGRALSTPPPPAEHVAIPVPPRPPAQQPVPTADIGLIDFVSLQPCRLQQVVAQRNSSLGKLAQPSQHLLNTIAYLRWVGPCIERLDREQDAELIAQLQRAAALKQADLAHLLWRVILGSGEAQQFWQRTAASDDYPASVRGGEASSAVEQLTLLSQAWLQGDYPYSGNQLETHLHHLSLGDGGQLLAAAALLQQQLNRANQLLANRLSVGAVCHHGRTSDAGTVLANVVRLFLIGEVQPWSVALKQRYYDLWPTLQQLEATLSDGEPERYRQWRQQRDRWLQHTLSSPRRHAQQLQPMLQSCSLAPARSND